jgi:hypothetical protein
MPSSKNDGVIGELSGLLRIADISDDKIKEAGSFM